MPADTRPPTPVWGPARCLQIAAWFALLTGLVEATVASVWVWMGNDLSLAPGVFWRAPMGALLWFGVPAAILAIWAATSGATPAIVVGVMAMIGWLAIVMTPGRLYVPAAVLLSVGLAVQTARFVTPRLPELSRLVRRTAVWMAAVVAVMLVTSLAGARSRESGVLDQLPDGPNAPNVLLLVIDTARAENLSLYHHARPTTPALEELAGRGVTFDRAIAPSSWTLPSHASMFTGHWAHELSANWSTPLDATYPTIAERLSEHGYATGGFVANLDYASPPMGLARGFQHYDSYSLQVGEIALATAFGRHLSVSARLRNVTGYQDLLGRKTAAYLNERVLRWIDGAGGDRPFFAFVNYFDVHQPVLPPEPYATRFTPAGGRRFDLLVRTTRSAWFPARLELPADEIAAEIAGYDGALSYVDDEIARLVGALEARGLGDDTLIVITSDHGEQFAEHGTFDHGNSLYQEEVHVPLVILPPAGLERPVRVADSVSLRDLPATVLDLTGLAPRAAAFPGRSLSRFWSPGAPDDREDVLSWVEVPDGPVIHALFEGPYKYVWATDGSEALFDLESDPDERRSLIDETSLGAVRDRLRARLAALAGVPVGSRE